MKKSMIVMMMIVIVFSMNLFGEVVSEKAVDHVCTAECKHEEVKKNVDQIVQSHVVQIKLL